MSCVFGGSGAPHSAGDHWQQRQLGIQRFHDRRRNIERIAGLRKRLPACPIPEAGRYSKNLAAEGGFMNLLKSGARIHEPGCLGCIGMGQAPGKDTISLRTFPEISGRSGTANDKVISVHTETAAASALKGVITDPGTWGRDAYARIREPESFLRTIHPDSAVPKGKREAVQAHQGREYQPFPRLEALETRFDGQKSS